jgi:hypothetical protein
MRPTFSEPGGMRLMCSGGWVTLTSRRPSAPTPIYRLKTWAICSSAIKRSVDDEHPSWLEAGDAGQAHR